MFLLHASTPRSVVCLSQLRAQVPFLSRQEAEATLRQRGMRDGDFVVRQTKNVPRGYVITSCFQGQIANSQLKNNNGTATHAL